VKTPRDFAGRLVADKDSKFCRLHFKLPQEEARLRARREFKFFPVETYLTEIDQWKTRRVHGQAAATAQTGPNLITAFTDGACGGRSVYRLSRSFTLRPVTLATAVKLN
jgi:hypothetical protein